jgi:hypothetical protein
MKKKSTKKVTPKKSSNIKRISSTDINERLVENFVSLQKVMTNMAKKFDNLSEHITKLLELFEISAKVLAEKDYKKDKSSSEEKQIKEHLENLLTQNKVIARGLTLMNEKILENSDEEVIPPIYKNPPQQQKENYEDNGKSSREVGESNTSNDYEKSLSTVSPPKPLVKPSFKKLPSSNQ